MDEYIEKPDVQYILHIESDKKVEKRLIDCCLVSVADVFEDTGLIADVQPVDGWISVDDELPKEWYEVLAYSEMGKIEKAIYVNGRWKLSAFLGETVEDVTHWQPLPEPPKEGDTNG